MADTLADLIVRLSGDITGFQKAMSDATRQLKTSASEFDAIGNKMTMAVTLPILGVGAAALKVAGELEQNKVAFTTMLGSADAAQRHLESLKKFALSTPFEFTDLTVASKRLQALGFAASDVIPTLTAVGNATAALGSGAEGIQRITTALGQMQAKGKVQAEEMRQLAEAGIPAWQILAKTLNTDVAGAMKMVEQRAVDSSVAVPALLAGMNQKFGGLMAQQSQTLLGQWSNFKDSAVFTLAEIGKILTPLAKQVLEVGQAALRTGKEWTQAFVNQPQLLRGMEIASIGLLAAIGPLAKGIAFVAGGAASLTAALAKGGLATSLQLLTYAIVAQTAVWATWFSTLKSGFEGTKEAGRYLAGVYEDLFTSAKNQASIIGNTAIDREKEKAIRAGAKAYEDFKKSTDAAAEAQAEFAKHAAEEAARVAKEYKTLVEAWKDFEQALANKKASENLQDQLVDMMNRAQSWREGFAQLVVLDPPKFKSIQPILDQIEQIRGATTTLQMALDSIQAPDINIYRDKRTSTEVLDEVIKKTEEITKESGKAKKAQTEWGRQVSTVFTDLSRSLADCIMGTKSFGEAFRDVGKAIVRIILEDIIKNAMGKLMKALGGVLDSFGGIGSAIGKAFGIGSKGASSAASGASSGSSALSSTGSAVASSFGNIFGMVTGAITAGASVVSAVWDVRMEGTLNAIEKEVRYTQIHALNILEKLNEYIPDLHEVRMWLPEYLLPMIKNIRDAITKAFFVQMTVDPTTEQKDRLIAAFIERALNIDYSTGDALMDTNSALRRLIEATSQGFRDTISTLRNSTELVLGQLHGLQKSTLEKVLSYTGIGQMSGLGSGLSNLVSGGSSLIGSLVGAITERAAGMDAQRTEENTRRASIDIHYLTDQTVNRFGPILERFWEWWNPAIQELPKIRVDMNDRLYEVIRALPSMGPTSSAGVTINITGASFSSKAQVDDVMNQVVYRLRLAGVAV